VLGPLEVRHGRDPVAVARPGCRALLAMLAMHPGRVLAVGELIEGLWGAAVPADPVGALQITVSRLRSALGSERAAVVHAGHGYCLDISAEAVDLGRAEARLDDARARREAHDHGGVVERCAAGLAQWRGQPLVEFVDLPFAALAASRIHVRKADLVLMRNEALLELDRPAEVLEHSRELLAADPWSERLAGQLMLALYRCGRPGEALEVYAAVSSALRADLGVEPSPELVALSDRIVRRSSTLGVATLLAGGTPDPGALPRWFEAALDAASGEETDDRVRCRLLLALGEARHWAGQPGWQDTLLEAAELARRIDDPVAVARATLGGETGWSANPGDPDRRRLELIEWALGCDGAVPVGLRARMLAAKATELALGSPLALRMELSDTAVHLARISGDPKVLLAVLVQQCGAVWAPETLALRRRVATEAVRLARAAGQELVEALASGMVMAGAVEDGDRHGAEAAFGRFGWLADRLDVPTLRWGVALHGSWLAALDDDLERAEMLAGRAAELGEAAGRPEAGLVHRTQVIAVRWAQDRIAEELDALGALATGGGPVPALSGLYAQALLGAGDEAGARALVDERCREETVAAWPHDAVYVSSLVHWAEVVHRLGDVDAARVLRGAAEPFRAHVAFAGAVVYGPAAYALGLLEQTLGDERAATSSLAAAAELARSMPAPLFVRRIRTVTDQSPRRARRPPASSPRP